MRELDLASGLKYVIRDDDNNYFGIYFAVRFATLATGKVDGLDLLFQ